ncbi:MAG: DAK2 domain-containing protein [Burkholderiales bacterium]|nr:DAK2 domain-containing protein [Anaerolineae bacterium]
MATQSRSTINLTDLFGSVASEMRQNQGYLNHLDSNGGNGNHGDQSVYNFDLVADAIGRFSGQDAQSQLTNAANVLQQQGRGATANIYAQGLREAGQRLQGRASLGLDDILPLLQGLLGGVQQQTQAQPGQGSMMDSLLPGIMGYVQARSAGRSNGDAIMDGISAATRGSRQVYTQPSQYGGSRGQGGQAWQDPGASSATSLLEGLFRSITGL